MPGDHHRSIATLLESYVLSDIRLREFRWGLIFRKARQAVPSKSQARKASYTAITIYYIIGYVRDGKATSIIPGPSQAHRSSVAQRRAASIPAYSQAQASISKFSQTEMFRPNTVID